MVVAAACWWYDTWCAGGAAAGPGVGVAGGGGGNTKLSLTQLAKLGAPDGMEDSTTGLAPPPPFVRAAAAPPPPAVRAAHVKLADGGGGGGGSEGASGGVVRLEPNIIDPKPAADEWPPRTIDVFGTGGAVSDCIMEEVPLSVEKGVVVGWRWWSSMVAKYPPPPSGFL